MAYTSFTNTQPFHHINISIQDFILLQRSSIRWVRAGHWIVLIYLPPYTSTPLYFKPSLHTSNFTSACCINFTVDTIRYTLLQLHSHSTHIWGTSRVKPGLKDILNKCRASTAYSPLFFYPFLCILQRKRPNCQPREMCRHLLKHSRFR